MSGPLRVFQVASGNVGTEMIKRIQNHPDLELVGLHCYSPDKVGRDAGETAGIGPIGVTTIWAVVEAPPGIVTSADLPLRAFAGRFKR
jgi:4-hydroxy-tetrahydrodipicolinate reductase